MRIPPRTARRIRAWAREQLRRAAEASPCADCGIDTTPVNGLGRPVPAWEWYALVDDVWQAAAATDDTILCIGCVEQRLGRRLTPADFTTAQVNSLDPANRRCAWWWRTPRLTARLCDTTN